MIDNFGKNILTLFGIGYFKYAPGTAASVVTCAFWLLLYSLKINFLLLVFLYLIVLFYPNLIFLVLTKELILLFFLQLILFFLNQLIPKYHKQREFFLQNLLTSLLNVFFQVSKYFYLEVFLIHF